MTHADECLLLSILKDCIGSTGSKLERGGDQAIQRQWNLVERFFNGIEHLRRIAMRFDKLTAIPNSATRRCSGSTGPDPG